MTDGVRFNGIHCNALNLTMLSSKRPLMPDNKDEYIPIPHKDGDFLIADKSAKDINVEVEFFLDTPPGMSFFDACRQVGVWLTTDERKRLIFDDDPGYFYNGKVTGNINTEQIAQYGAFTVVFRCKPYAKGV